MATNSHFQARAVMAAGGHVTAAKQTQLSACSCELFNPGGSHDRLGRQLWPPTRGQWWAAQLLVVGGELCNNRPCCTLRPLPLHALAGGAASPTATAHSSAPCCQLQWGARALRTDGRRPAWLAALAGGSGRRSWRCSRHMAPCQGSPLCCILDPISDSRGLLGCKWVQSEQRDTTRLVRLPGLSTHAWAQNDDRY